MVDEDLQGITDIRDLLSLVDIYPLPTAYSSTHPTELERIQKIIVFTIFTMESDDILLLGMLREQSLYERRLTDLTWSDDENDFS